MTKEKLKLQLALFGLGSHSGGTLSDEMLKLLLKDVMQHYKLKYPDWQGVVDKFARNGFDEWTAAIFILTCKYSRISPQKHVAKFVEVISKNSGWKVDVKARNEILDELNIYLRFTGMKMEAIDLLLDVTFGESSLDYRRENQMMSRN